MSLLHGSHFEFFGLPVHYAIDETALDNAYRKVQMRVHPDRFAAADEAQKRVAMQWATRANDAYRILKDPLQRAIHLLHLRGVEMQAESNTKMEAAFLTQQLAWRERLEEAAASKNTTALNTLLDVLRKRTHVHFAELSRLLEAHADQEAAEVGRQLMFIERATHQVRAQLEKIDSTA